VLVSAVFHVGAGAGVGQASVSSSALLWIRAVVPVITVRERQMGITGAKVPCVAAKFGHDVGKPALSRLCVNRRSARSEIGPSLDVTSRTG
jgi:hypothetical protein